MEQEDKLFRVQYEGKPLKERWACSHKRILDSFSVSESRAGISLGREQSELPMFNYELKERVIENLRGLCINSITHSSDSFPVLPCYLHVLWS